MEEEIFGDYVEIAIPDKESNKTSYIAFCREVCSIYFGNLMHSGGKLLNNTKSDWICASCQTSLESSGVETDAAITRATVN